MIIRPKIRTKSFFLSSFNRFQDMTVQPRLKDYVFTERLGSGSYAVVYKAYRKDTQRDVSAIKCVMKSSLTKRAVDNLLTEISILKKLKHEYIVEMKDFLWDDNYIYIIMEFCSGGDLSNYIRHRRRLPELLVKQFLQQLAKCFQFLRTHNIAHMDLKPQNILLSSRSKPVLKIADFGFAQYMQKNEVGNSMRGSPLYMAPEILLKQEYDARVDLWSIGVVLYECLFGQAPFTSKSFAELAEKIKSSDSIEIPYGVHISDNCRELILGLLKRNPSERIDFEHFFSHQFLDLSYMATSESLAKGIELASNAVKKDIESKYAESVQLYCEALLYLVPHVHAEWDPSRKSALRNKVSEYMNRAEELKSCLRTNNLALDKEESELRHKLHNFSCDDPKINASLKLLKHGEQLEDQEKFTEAYKKYELGLNTLMTVLSVEPTGERKVVLQKQVQMWLKRAERVKSYLSIDKAKSAEQNQINNSIHERTCAIQ